MYPANTYVIRQATESDALALAASPRSTVSGRSPAPR